MERYRQHLGEPDPRLGDLQLWVHGPEVVDPQPYEDWLRVSVHCGGQGASVWVRGEILQYGDLRDWVDQTEALYRDLRGVATRSVRTEPLRRAQRRSHRRRCCVRPDHAGYPASGTPLLVRARSVLPPEFLAQGRRLLNRFVLKVVR